MIKNEIMFTIPGNPRGKARPRFSHGHAYTPQTTKIYEKCVAAQACAAGIVAGVDTVSVRVKAFYKIPTSLRKSKRDEMCGMPCPKKPDADNVLKIVLDGLQAVIGDDAQVAYASCEKRWSFEPRVEVYVGEFDGRKEE